MAESGTNYRALLRFVFSTSLRFPIPEVLFSLFLFVSCYQMLSSVFFGIFLHIEPGPSWVGDSWLEDLAILIETAPVSALAHMLPIIHYVLIFLLPMLIAFNLGGSHESGLLRSLLSIPITRRIYLLFTGGITILLTGLATSLGLIVARFISFPQPIDWGLVFLMMTSVWTYVLLVGSGSILLAIVLRSAQSSSFSSIGLWFLVMVVGLFTSLPLVIKGVLNPILITSSYVTGSPYARLFGEIVFNDVIVSLMGATVVGIILLIIGLVVFERVEL